MFYRLCSSISRLDINIASLVRHVGSDEGINYGKEGLEDEDFNGSQVGRETALYWGSGLDLVI